MKIKVKHVEKTLIEYETIESTNYFIKILPIFNRVNNSKAKEVESKIFKTMNKTLKDCFLKFDAVKKIILHIQTT